MQPVRPSELEFLLSGHSVAFVFKLKVLNVHRQSACLSARPGQRGSDLASRLLVPRTVACPFSSLPRPHPHPCLDTYERFLKVAFKKLLKNIEI